MRHEETPAEQTALREEHLTDVEVHEILSRLSAQEMGGSELATIGAVSEATGAAPEVIGKMLAEIRQQNLREQFGSRLDDHESKLRRLEQDAQRARSPVAAELPTDEIQREVEAIARERIAARKFLPAIPIVVGLGFVIAYNVLSPSRDVVTRPRIAPIIHELKGGQNLYVEPDGSIWVRMPSGEMRPPTAEERREGERLRQLVDRR